MLYYPTFYEGLEQSKNVIYTGQEATQQILAGLNWVPKREGRQELLPARLRLHLAAHLEQDRPQAHRERAQGSRWSARSTSRSAAPSSTPSSTRSSSTKPDVIYAIIVGGSNVAFYKQLKAAGIDLNKQTLMTISVTEDEIDGIGGENIVGAYACMKYFQSLDNPNNKAFVAGLQEDVGRARPSSATSPRPPISGPGCGSSPPRRPAASTSTRSPPRRPASNSRARRRAMSASTRTIICGARPGSGAPAPTASTTWSTRRRI